MPRPDSDPTPIVRHRKHFASASLSLLAVLLFTAACTPATVGPSDPGATSGSAARTVELPGDFSGRDPLLRTAWEAWLLMELRQLRDGSYSTDALLDLALPSGVRWTVIEYGPNDYTLAVTGDGSTDTLRVDPSGVHVHR